MRGLQGFCPLPREASEPQVANKLLVSAVRAAEAIAWAKRSSCSERAFSLACEKYVYHLDAVEEMLGDKIPVVWPEEDPELEKPASFTPLGEGI